MENIRSKFADYDNVDTTTATITDSYIKSIPVLGTVYSVTGSLNNILTKAFPNVFSSSGAINSKLEQQIDQKTYNALKNTPLFMIGYSDANFTTPYKWAMGVILMCTFANEDDPAYKSILKDAGVLGGVGSKPITDGLTNAPNGYYPIFPNVLQNTLNTYSLSDQSTLASEVSELKQNVANVAPTNDNSKNPTLNQISKTSVTPNDTISDSINKLTAAIPVSTSASSAINSTTIIMIIIGIILAIIILR
jgi:hypothetical protein